jgi:hypothetical protein
VLLRNTFEKFIGSDLRANRCKSKSLAQRGFCF